MARRRKSAIEDFLSLVSKAPWPVGVGLAAVSFIVLNHIAQGGPVQGNSVSDISNTVIPNLAITVAGVAASFCLPFSWLRRLALSSAPVGVRASSLRLPLNRGTASRTWTGGRSSAS